MVASIFYSIFKPILEGVIEISWELMNQFFKKKELLYNALEKCIFFSFIDNFSIPIISPVYHGFLFVCLNI